MAKLINITGKALSGEWGTDDETGDGIPVLRTTNFTNEGVVDYNNVVTRTITKKNIGEKFLCSGDIIIEKSGGSDKQPVGRVIYFDGPENTYLFNNFTGLLRVQDKERWFPKYVFYSLYENYRRGGTRPFENKTTGLHNLKTDDYISRYEVTEADYQKQVDTCESLDRLYNIIKYREKELSKLDDLIKARFVEMFGERGKVLPLTSYVWFQEGPGVRSVDFTPEGTNLLTGSNINDNELSFGYKSDRFISDELANGKYAHFMCDKDDILVVSSAIAPEKFDKKVIIVEEDKKYCLNTGIIRFKPNREVMTLGYFREFLKTDYFKHQVMAEMRGIAQMHFGPSHLKQMTILLPESMEQQIEFEKFVTQVDKSKVVVQKYYKICYNNIILTNKTLSHK